MPTIGPLKVKAQVLCAHELAMGPGKADLLEAIDREGSISGAGRALGMSYRRTWLLVDTMNRCWKRPLVEATAGGGRQSGARLTDCGREILAAYRDLEGRMADAVFGPSLATLEGLLLPAPREARHDRTHD